MRWRAGATRTRTRFKVFSAVAAVARMTPVMERTGRLLAACNSGDEDELARLGWRPVLDLLRCWPGRVTGTVLAPFAQSSLAQTDPDQIVVALQALLAVRPRYRPAVVEVLEQLHPTSVPAARRAAARRDARIRVVAAGAVAAGATPCECQPRPVDWRLDKDNVGILCCYACGGLDPGQYDDAVAELSA